MRRTIAAVCLGLSQLVAGLTIAGWWLQQTAFSPSRSEDVAVVILDNDAVRQEMTEAITDAVADQLGVETATIATIANEALDSKEGGKLLANVMAQAHAVMIGASEDPVTVAPQQVARVVGDARALQLPAVVIPVPKVGALDATRRFLDTFVPIGAVLSVVLAVVGLIAHPDKARFLRVFGAGLFVIAALLIILGFLVPRFVVPALTDIPWVDAVPKVASDAALLVFALALLAVGLGVAAIAGASYLQRRREVAWPTGVGYRGWGTSPGSWERKDWRP